MIDKIKTIIKQNFCDLLSRNKLGYIIRFVEDEQLQLKHIDFGRDYRLDNKQHKGSFISLVAVDNCSKQIIAGTSFILISPAYFGDVKFWRHDKEHSLLQQISLYDLIRELSQTAITIGFTRMIKNSKDKMQLTLTFVKLVKRIISEPGIFTFMESTGVENLSDKLQKQPILSLSKVDAPVSINKLGVSRPESKAVEVSAKLIGLKEASDIYNRRTLGKVYFSSIESEHA